MIVVINHLGYLTHRWNCSYVHQLNAILGVPHCSCGTIMDGNTIKWTLLCVICDDLWHMIHDMSWFVICDCLWFLICDDLWWFVMICVWEKGVRLYYDYYTPTHPFFTVPHLLPPFPGSWHAQLRYFVINTGRWVTQPEKIIHHRFSSISRYETKGLK